MAVHGHLTVPPYTITGYGRVLEASLYPVYSLLDSGYRAVELGGTLYDPPRTLYVPPWVHLPLCPCTHPWVGQRVR